MTTIPQTEKKYVLADILRKRDHQHSIGEDRQKRIQEKRESRKTQTKDDFVHPEKFVKAYRKQQKAYAHWKQKTNKLRIQGETISEVNTTLHDIPLNRTIIVVRIRGQQDISDVQTKTLQLLRLKRINTCVFFKTTPKIIRMLKRVENYVAFGYGIQLQKHSIPSRQLISMLIFKRAHIQHEKQMVPLTSNQLVEDNLGTKNIICLEDIVEELVKTGPNIIPVSTFLCPFKLNHPRTGLKSGKIKKPFAKGGEWGYREEKINELIERMI